nr:immunoglobulin heavy chain junction region [Macaca mulatta]
CARIVVSCSGGICYQIQWVKAGSYFDSW